MQAYNDLKKSHPPSALCSESSASYSNLRHNSLMEKSVKESERGKSSRPELWKETILKNFGKFPESRLWESTHSNAADTHLSALI